ncbi:nuclear transport factor 2 family protein [Actinomycetospora rhizophila]|uniref:Nuclear transport factor 2 family protein n=1 Tax=Actinomycetospora rhizophila TaxID=1416876 RepID=A0ABV9ZD36_9PSEU
MTGTTTARAVDAPAWLVEFYGHVDALDTEAVLARFAPDASMRYGAGDPLPGHEAIRAGLTYLFTTYRRIGHEFLGVWESGTTLMLEATVTYGLPDGREVAVPALTVIEHRDGAIDDLRIFIDPTPAQVG